MQGYDNRRELKQLLLLGLVLSLLLICLILALGRFKSIQVIGNEHYSDSEIIELVFPDYWDGNSFYQFVKEHTGEHIALPFVEKYELNWNGPLDMELIVYEKDVIGYVSFMSSYMYFDKDGIVVESTGIKLKGIPEIKGLGFGSIVLYKPLPVENTVVFNDILNLTGSLSLHGIECESISYDKLLNAELKLGELTVKLGQNKSMEMKLSTLSDILPNIEGRRGVLDLSVYIEDREREAYVFKETK